MNGRDRDDGVGMGILKLGLGAGVGFALFMLISGTGGFGFGRGRGGGPGVPAPPVVPPRPPDTKPVEVRVKPAPTDPKKAVIELEGKIISVGDLVARIEAGGRRDVLVTVRGDTIQGAWDEIRNALVSAGIQISIRQPSASPATPARNV